MKKIKVIFISLLCFLSLFVHSQNAPVTTAAIVTDAIPGNNVVIPITVSAFNNIGTISLTLDFNPAVLTYVSGTHDPLFQNMIISNVTAGRITVSWFGSPGISVPDGTPIIELTFTYITGYTDLTWYDNGGSCEYADGNANALNDTPTSTYYKNGHVSQQAAPVTYAPTISNAVPGNVSIPVTVDGFTSIGTISLTLEYDPLVLTYVSATPNAAFVSEFSVSSAPGTGGKYNITISWFGSPAVTLDSGSTLVTLNFTYTNENGMAFSALTWKDNGSSCEYSNASSEVLWDSPTAYYYRNGLVEGQSSPITFLPLITDAPSGVLWIPVRVTNFNNIAAMALTFEYDPAVMTYVTYSTIVSGLSVGSQALPNGHRKIVIGRYGSPVTLADSAILVNLKFNFISGTTALTFIDDGESCAYSDEAYNPLYDIPTAYYYHNGLVTGQLAPRTYLPVITNAVPGDISVPLTVYNFHNIGSISLTFDYDPAVLTYTEVISSALTGMNVTDQAIAGGLREITIAWYTESTAATLADGTVLIDLKFNYIMGTSALTFYDNGGSCEYADGNFYALYDVPTQNYYFNGLVASQLAPLIKADSVSGVVGGLITISVRVWGFNGINSFSLTMDYNPAVVTFDCATPNALIAANFSASDVSSGRLEMGWFGDATTLADGSVLMYLTFLYTGGTTPMTWFDDGATCQFTAGDYYLPLYDLPTVDFYKNGLVIPSPSPAVWTGNTSSAWSLPANWSPAVIPDSFFDVFINGTPTPPNWPLFTGDFNIGGQCKSLTLTGAAQMQVTGDMTIQPGHLLEMTGAGLLKVGSDWNDYGIFIPGTGMVDFTGTADGNIDQGTYPATSLSAYAYSTFTAGMTALVGGTAGPTGDNAHSDVALGFTFNYLGVDYTQIRINTNGWASLNLSGDDATSGSNNNLFFTDAPGTALAPWWDDLKADGSTAINYQSSGGVFTVEWKNILAYSFGATTRLNFQLKLYSGTNVIEFCYGAVSAGTNNADETASIGIKDATGGIGRFIEATTGTGNTVKTCLVSSSDWPAVNYRFSPPSALGTEVFWKLAVSKTGAAMLNIKRDVQVAGK